MHSSSGRHRRENQKLNWEEALDAYKRKLKADGLSEQAAESNIRLVTAYDEAELYDQVYSGPPKFNTQPNDFLVDAVADLPPGDALDVGMGQGRNSIYLASRGWKVTGFDVAEVGLRRARAEAARLGLSFTAVQAADEEFDFGRDRWDLIVIIYAIEKRSVPGPAGAQARRDRGDRSSAPGTGRVSVRLRVQRALEDFCRVPDPALRGTAWSRRFPHGSKQARTPGTADGTEAALKACAVSCLRIVRMECPVNCTK